MTRREMLRRAALALPVIAASPSVLCAETPIKRNLGIGMHSYGFAWKAAKDKSPSARFTGALSFLEYAHSISAAGVQVSIRPEERDDARKIRSRAEELGVYFESQLALPKDRSDLSRFQDELKAIVDAGATVARTTVLGSRRYETMKSATEFRVFAKQGRQMLALAEPIARKLRVRLAIENHKDYLTPDLTKLLREMASEWIGACVDTGNNLALLEDPYAVVEALAPFAVTTHVKDMAVRESDDGFLLSEIPLGQGFLNLPRIVSTLRSAKPGVHLVLEMITRDPLRVPCLTPGYWTTLGDLKASQLAEGLQRIRKYGSSQPLPRTTGLPTEQQVELEDRNVRQCIVWAREHLS